jgi:hypothetical protein
MRIVLEIVLFAFIFLQLKRKKCTNFEIKNRRKRMRTIKYFDKEISVDEFIKQYQKGLALERVAIDVM